MEGKTDAMGFFDLKGAEFVDFLCVWTQNLNPMKTTFDAFTFNVELISPKTQTTWILPIYAKGEMVSSVKAMDQKMNGVLNAQIRRQQFNPEKDKSALMYPQGLPNVLFLGVGEKGKTSRNDVRQAYALAGKNLNAKKHPHVSIVETGDAKIDAHLDAALEGFVQGAYAFDKYLSEDAKEKKPKKDRHLALVGLTQASEKKLQKILDATLPSLRAIFMVRDMVNDPANIIHPESFEKIATEMAKTHQLKLKVFHQKDLIQKGFHLHNAVGMGSDIPPRLLHLEYVPKNKNAKTVALIGKGVTFDSGGLSLKPQNYMYGMKGDMAGAAATLAIMTLLPQVECKTHVHALIPLVENLVSGRSVKPGDVFKAYNGKSVEIENTDAEGRLIMADALAYASKELSPDLLIDMATLTGAIVVALGEEICGVMGTDQKSIQAILKLTPQTGEKFWQLPLEESYKKMLKSDVADLKNVGAKFAGAITAGLFLKEFVGETPWVHLDIAGPSMVEQPDALGVKGATGFPVKTVVEFLKKY